MGDREQRPGDWYCPKCDDLQFSRNRECRTLPFCGSFALQPLLKWTQQLVLQHWPGFAKASCSEVVPRKCGEPKPIDGGDRDRDRDPPRDRDRDPPRDRSYGGGGGGGYGGRRVLQP